MKPLLFTLTFCLTAIFLFSQSFPNGNFEQLETKPCPYGNPVSVTLPKYWEIYQTKDSTAFGEIDSSRCFSGSYDAANNGFKLFLNQMDTTKPLFIRYVNPSYEYIAHPNLVYNVSFEGRISSTAFFQTGTDCKEGLCTGFFFKHFYPDSAMTNIFGEHLVFQAPMARSGGGGATFRFIRANTCIATAYDLFPKQKFDDIVIKYTHSYGNPNAFIILQRLKIEPEYPYLHSEVLVPQFFYQDTAYTFSSNYLDSDPYSGTSHLFQYDTTSYPNPASPYFCEVRPDPNPAQQETINFILDDMESVRFQPFTDLRGGTIAGSDSVRHLLNLIVDSSSDFCFTWAELVFDADEKMVAKGGAFGFNDAYSCMSFRPKSKFLIQDKHVLHYGTQGQGMLLLCPEAELDIQKGSTLYFDGHLVLSDCGAHGPTEIHLTRGSELIFSEYAKISSPYSPDRKVSVFLEGGRLDLSRLGTESLDFIELYHSKPEVLLKNNISVFPNPFSEALQFDFLSEKEETLVVQLFSLDGKLNVETAFKTELGFNVLSLPTEQLPNGLYLLKIKSGTQQMAVRLLKF